VFSEILPLVSVVPGSLQGEGTELMRRFRISMRGLMIAIVLLGTAFAALRMPTPLWANVWFSLVLATLTLAVPAVVYRRGERRAFWVGFAACGWVYFILSLAPWLQGEFGFQLVTTTVLDLLAPYIVQKEYLLRTYIGSFNPPTDPAPPSPWQTWNLPEFPPDNPWRRLGYVTLSCPGLYLRIGHAVFCMLVAFVGGEITRYLAATGLRSTATERRS
jgi:hypothetical protein